jgi:hypothetical protein
MGETAHETDQGGTAKQEDNENVERGHGVRLAAASPKFQPLSTEDLVDQGTEAAELRYADAVAPL